MTLIDERYSLSESALAKIARMKRLEQMLMWIAAVVDFVAALATAVVVAEVLAYLEKE